MHDPKQLIAAVRAKHGIRIEPDDPVFALVTLNELVLEEAIRRLSEDMDRRLVTFGDGMDRTERRAGKLLAEDVRNAAAKIREEMQKDIEAAGMQAAHLVYKVDQAHKTLAMTRWIGVGLFSAMVLIVFAFCAGMYFHS
jgi:Transcriptional activator TraM